MGKWYDKRAAGLSFVDFRICAVTLSLVLKRAKRGLHSAVAILKFLIILNKEIPHVHFALGPTNYGAGL